MSREFEPYQRIERSIITKYKKEIWNPFTHAVRDYDLIQAGDKIAVCISGGKDSMLMAKLFQELERHGKKNFEVVYLVMNPGYNEDNWTTCNISTSTAYYKWNSTSKTYESDVAESLLPAKDSSAAEASRVVVIIMNNQVKAVYILANE